MSEALSRDLDKYREQYGQANLFTIARGNLSIAFKTALPMLFPFAISLLIIGLNVKSALGADFSTSFFLELTWDVALTGPLSWLVFWIGKKQPIISGEEWTEGWAIGEMQKFVMIAVGTIAILLITLLNVGTVLLSYFFVVTQSGLPADPMKLLILFLPFMAGSTLPLLGYYPIKDYQESAFEWGNES